MQTLTLKYRQSSSPTPILALCLLISACAPHPGSGTWQADNANPYGIQRLVLEYDGKASFTSTRKEPADWHCFWGGISPDALSLNCTPSSHPERAQTFRLDIKDNGTSKLSRDGVSIGLFNRVKAS